MNILELQEDIKDYPDKELVREMQMPSGSVPQYLVLTELTRRKRMRDEYNRQEAKDIQTVAEEVVTASGVPQGGLTAMAGALASDTNVTQDTGVNQAMSTQATRAPQQPQMAADGGLVRLANGGGVRSGTVTNAIASLKVNFPGLYEQYKDEPKILEQIALSQLEGKDKRIAETELAFSQVERFADPDKSFVEDIGTFDFTDKANPFKPTASMFKMDDSGKYRGPIDRFTDSISKFGQSFAEYDELGRSLGNTDLNALMYPPAQPGEYKYQGNMFTLNPDGSMVSEAGIPVDDAGKAAILAANLPKVPIPNYGEQDKLPPGAIIQDFASLIADDSDGTPVEPLDIYNLPQSIIDARKMSAPELNLTKDPTILGGFDDDMTASSITPTRIDVPNNVNAERPPAFDRYPEPAIPESPDLSDFQEKERQDLIRKYLAEGRIPGIADLRDDVNEGIREDGGRLRQNQKLLQQDIDSVGGDLSQLSPYGELSAKALQYYQDDQYTPPEEIYSGDPREIAKYEGATEEEIQLISDRLAAEASADEAKKIAGTETRRNVEEELAAEDAAEFLALNQPAGLTKTERAQLKAKGFLNPVFDAIDENRDKREKRENETALSNQERSFDQPDSASKEELATLAELKRLAEEARGTGKASGEATDLDAEIARQLQKLYKERDTNKWLALAEAGMKMMSSKSPTLLGSIGEGGLAGTKALRTSQSADSKDRLGLLALQQRSDAAKTKGGMTSYQRQMSGKGFIKDGNDMIAAGMLAGDPNQVAEGRQLVAYGRAIAGLPSLGSSGMTRTTVPAQV